jgi:predicted metal-dependent phosphoesterase TrpH
MCGGGQRSRAIQHKATLEGLCRALQTERRQLRETLDRYHDHVQTSGLPLPTWAAEDKARAAVAAAAPSAIETDPAGV